eukprot:CAMPEP_0116946950 /NCGR_PEP_ID=MMETSP0467-20121206/37341_1 /TAXON_ID=283647 /ORGANISM="Mesodinium pulex, Strain SPMC105" /LENGTH=163 /DNA_ID=CAMNT_0004630927 /DNA_START=1134 /DNA_END=1625 /DNA_ORIENTATION=-
MAVSRLDTEDRAKVLHFAKPDTFHQICALRHSVMVVTPSVITGDYELPLDKDKIVRVVLPVTNEEAKWALSSPYKNLEDCFKADADWVAKFREANQKNEERFFVFFNATVTNVEQFNTLCDDNKLLCLQSGERIALTSNVRLVFIVGEQHSTLSPAFCSRQGV